MCLSKSAAFSAMLLPGPPTNAEATAAQFPSARSRGVSSAMLSRIPFLFDPSNARDPASSGRLATTGVGPRDHRTLLPKPGPRRRTVSARYAAWQSAAPLLKLWFAITRGYTKLLQLRCYTPPILRVLIGNQGRSCANRSRLPAQGNQRAIRMLMKTSEINRQDC